MPKKNQRRPGPVLFMVQIALFTAMVSLVALWVWVSDLPDFDKLKQENPSKTAFMKYREKSGIYGKPIWVPLNQIAPELKYSVIVAEDAKFFHHNGLDWEALWNAQRRNWTERRLYRGGSTITQQLAKNLYLDPSKTVLRKLKELAITIRLERSLKKNRILELYLNVIEWGRGIYGAEAASRHYFGKSASRLTIEEASWLAAILPSPLRYERNRASRYARERSEWIAGFVRHRMGKK